MTKDELLTADNEHRIIRWRWVHMRGLEPGWYGFLPSHPEPTFKLKRTRDGRYYELHKVWYHQPWPGGAEYSQRIPTVVRGDLERLKEKAEEEVSDLEKLALLGAAP